MKRIFGELFCSPPSPADDGSAPPRSSPVTNASAAPFRMLIICLFIEDALCRQGLISARRNDIARNLGLRAARGSMASSVDSRRTARRRRARHRFRWSTCGSNPSGLPASQGISWFPCGGQDGGRSPDRPRLQASCLLRLRANQRRMAEPTGGPLGVGDLAPTGAAVTQGIDVEVAGRIGNQARDGDESSHFNASSCAVRASSSSLSGPKRVATYSSIQTGSTSPSKLRLTSSATRSDCRTVPCR